jgi:hypothetical protein
MITFCYAIRTIGDTKMSTKEIDKDSLTILKSYEDFIKENLNDCEKMYNCCRDCTYSVDIENLHLQYECRYNSPTIQDFPIMPSNGWCGRFKKKLTEG